MSNRDPIAVAGDLVRRRDKLSVEGASTIKQLVADLRALRELLDQGLSIAQHRLGAVLPVGFHRCLVRLGGKGKPVSKLLYWDGEVWRWSQDSLIVDPKCNPQVEANP